MCFSHRLNFFLSSAFILKVFSFSFIPPLKLKNLFVLKAVQEKFTTTSKSSRETLLDPICCKFGFYRQLLEPRRASEVRACSALVSAVQPEHFLCYALSCYHGNQTGLLFWCLSFSGKKAALSASHTPAR